MTPLTKDESFTLNVAVSPERAVDGALFRTALSLWPAGVAVVTTMGPDGPAGMTVSSFTSISLSPPLVGFYAGLGSATWALIEQSRRFAINVLSDRQSELCGRFARRDSSFDGVDWATGASGAPVIADTVCVIDCDVAATVELGDHILVVGAVIDARIPQSPPGPLLWHDRRTASLRAHPA